MDKFETHWAIARKTMDCALYDRAVNGMLQSASNADQHNAAIRLSLNGKSPELIRSIDQIVGIKQED